MTALKSLIKRGFDDFSIRRMFDDFDEPFLNEFWTKPYYGFNFKFSPKVDILEDKENLYINAEIPGVIKEDVRVTMNDGLLTISGEKKKEEIKEKANYFRMERSEGTFARSFTVPVPVNNNMIKAEFKEGILKIILPKADEVKNTEKEIEIK